MVKENHLIWAITALSTAGVILRPLNIPEVVWAAGGAVILVVFGLLPMTAALAGAGRGLDVYLFLTGMMLLAELARQEGLFDWLAARAVSLARGSATRLFALIYIVGILVTVFLSNDATAVVLTPAVAAAARTAKVDQPLPFLFICAFIANAASFVLPISNPANLVIYGNQMPSLLQWLPQFALPSVLSIGATFLVLRWTQRDALRQPVAADVEVPILKTGGKAAAAGIVVTALMLMLASAFDLSLGFPTLCAGAATLALVCLITRSGPAGILQGVSWSVIPLVAGLFILVEAIDRSGAIHALSMGLRDQATKAPRLTAAAAGVILSLVSNLINNLPAGLIAGTAVQTARVPASVSSAVLIGVDLGPNLSVTGSLATILWLTALRRDNIEVRAWDFFKVGLLVMFPALISALAGLQLMGAHAQLL